MQSNSSRDMQCHFSFKFCDFLGYKVNSCFRAYNRTTQNTKRGLLNVHGKDFIRLQPRHPESPALVQFRTSDSLNKSQFTYWSFQCVDITERPFDVLWGYVNCKISACHLSPAVLENMFRIIIQRPTTDQIKFVDITRRRLFDVQ
ncbi:hypothetical protein KUTeg_010984 [Tegillarca granosa]|uniref:Uncharacterized protein n=1 Tax=Tegillarca granosa TaxID=220873 RepID=A0ABQ9F2J2_TEGGR|nr:hypothetical protein KUTeg_010984 [Tegillarca granosa]